MTARESIDLNRRQNRLRRGRGKVRGESVIAISQAEADQQALAQVTGDELTPGFAVMMSEQICLLLGLLEDPERKDPAMAKMEGYNNLEIAARRICSERTIERRLKLIRAKCSAEFQI